MEFSLYIISHIGMVISLVCLILAITTFLLCRAIRNNNTYLHLHLCVCLFLAKILFLTGVDKTDNQVSYPSDCAPPSPIISTSASAHPYPTPSIVVPTSRPLNVLCPLLITLTFQHLTWLRPFCDRSQFKIISLIILCTVVVPPVTL